MSVVHRLDTLIDAVTARHGHSPMGLEMACVRLIKEQHTEIKRLRAAVLAEREACAQILDANAAACKNNSMLRDVLMGNAAAIRARGEKS